MNIVRDVHINSLYNTFVLISVNCFVLGSTLVFAKTDGYLSVTCALVCLSTLFSFFEYYCNNNNTITHTKHAFGRGESKKTTHSLIRKSIFSVDFVSEYFRTVAFAISSDKNTLTAHTHHTSTHNNEKCSL